MRALVLKTDRSSWSKTTGYQARDVPEPDLNQADADAAIVEPLLSGVCGTDKAIWQRKGFKELILSAMERQGRDYCIMGHEMVGRISALGEAAAKAGKFKVGQIVSTESHLYCGKCPACLAGDRHVCTSESIIGVSADGCFAERIKLPTNVLWPTDLDKIRLEVAAIQEPFGNALHVCNPSPGVGVQDRDIAIFGCGTIGIFAIMIARAMGARRILGVEPNPVNAEKAKAAGADKVIEPGPDVAREIHRYFDNFGAHMCFEMSGHPLSLPAAIEGAGNGGHIVLFGVQSGEFRFPDLEDFIERGKHIHAVIGRRIFDTWEQSRQLLEDRSNGIQDKIWDLILDRGEGSILSLSDFAPELMEAKMNQHAKILLQINS